MRWSMLVAVLPFSIGHSVAEEPVSYTRDIKPLLKERCFTCHGALKQKGGLRLDTVALMRQGGEHGPAVEPGKADQSVLLRRVTAVGVGRMPPASEGEALSAGQIALVRAWINQGATGPAHEKAEADPREHWAFRPPQRLQIPRVKDAAWTTNPIDAFIAAAHERHGLVPQVPASKPALLRRVYLDLIGLPATRAELQAFLADTSADAYGRVVERLLASPQYGERWARHWMDVWRYSDWYGRRAVPDVWNSAPQIWRWRDWIVQSLNSDKGYDRMVQEMLAADEIAPEDDAAAAATGYIVRNWYALNPNQWMRDLVEHTGKAFLGLTFNCAHCHDHKYDPIAHEDYFRLRAFFEPVQLRQDRVPGEGDPGPFQKYDYSRLRKVVNIGVVRVFDERPDAKTYVYLQGDERLQAPGKPPVKPGVPAFLGKVPIEALTLPPTVSYPGLKPFIQREEIVRRQHDLARAQVAAALGGSQGSVFRALLELLAVQARVAADNARAQHAANTPDLARAASKAEGLAALFAAQDKLAQAEQAWELARQKLAAMAAGKEKDVALLAAKKAETLVANHKAAVALATKNFAAATDKYTPLSPTYPTTSTGRRRALALWLTARDNPLTARVAVNHIWMRHFERPLVETVFDFGRNGKKPSHPELLEWLAVELMDSGWSMKHLHRLIVTSKTYCQESAVGTHSPNLARDADNRLLWHANTRRMEAEVVRDSILYLAGALDQTLGGPVIENTQEATSKRRSLYFSVFPEDGGHLKFLEIFDAPDTCDCYRRDYSVMPQQALALTNNHLAINHSRLLAKNLSAAWGLAPPDPSRDQTSFIDAAFEQILTRSPSAEERALCRDFLNKQAALYRQSPAQPSASAGTIGPSTNPALRARESLVRALFSHNDFVTIR